MQESPDRRPGEIRSASFRCSRLPQAALDPPAAADFGRGRRPGVARAEPGLRGCVEREGAGGGLTETSKQLRTKHLESLTKGARTFAKRVFHGGGFARGRGDLLHCPACRDSCIPRHAASLRVLSVTADSCGERFRFRDLLKSPSMLTPAAHADHEDLCAEIGIFGCPCLCHSPVRAVLGFRC